MARTPGPNCMQCSMGYYTSNGKNPDADSSATTGFLDALQLCLPYDRSRSSCSVTDPIQTTMLCEVNHKEFAMGHSHGSNYFFWLSCFAIQGPFVIDLNGKFVDSRP